MKKFCKAITFVCVVAMLFYTMNNSYEQSSAYRSIEGIYKYDDVPQQLQIVNVGNSHSLYGIDYTDYTDLSTFNFAFASQMLCMDAAVLQTYKDHLAENCVVLIQVSYFSFSTEFEVLYDGQESRYYRILAFDNIPNKSLEELMIYRWFPILSAQRNVVDIFTEDSQELSNSMIEQPPFTSEEEWRENGEMRATYHEELITTCPTNSQEMQINGLKTILDMCLENGWTPVLVTTPYTNYYNQAFPQALKDDFYRTISKLQEMYPQVPYYDFSSDERFYSETAYFVDADHLNQKGRIYFTEILMDTLREDLQT